MAEPEFTTDQLLAGIANAIKARDFKAVDGILKLLALQDPHQAEAVYKGLKAVTAVWCT